MTQPAHLQRRAWRANTARRIARLMAGQIHQNVDFISDDLRQQACRRPSQATSRQPARRRAGAR